MTGEILIYSYLPHQLLLKSVQDMSFDEFFKYYAMAEYARDMKIHDIEIGVAKGICAALGEDEN